MGGCGAVSGHTPLPPIHTHTHSWHPLQVACAHQADSGTFGFLVPTQVGHGGTLYHFPEQMDLAAVLFGGLCTPAAPCPDIWEGKNGMLPGTGMGNKQQEQPSRPHGAVIQIPSHHLLPALTYLTHI